MPASVISVNWCQMSSDTAAVVKCHIPLGYDTDTRPPKRHAGGMKGYDTTQRRNTRHE